MGNRYTLTHIRQLQQPETWPLGYRPIQNMKKIITETEIRRQIIRDGKNMSKREQQTYTENAIHGNRQRIHQEKQERPDHTRNKRSDTPNRLKRK